jgi:FemAB-related protein (PEP-CTERM system-associated)
MARKGSLVQYATGTPDSFYNIRQPEFRQLFRRLREQGCEIGLHASFNAYRCVEQLRNEKQLLEEAAQVEVGGNRHHYWHLDPEAPHDTLLANEQAGLLYDSSLGFEFYPGYRRGICHPFRIYHPGERRELDIVELPPAWMDDHFDQRLVKNRIADPVAYARQLVNVARATGGVIVVDYHLRGMNEDFFPRYAAWLMQFVRDYLEGSVSFHTSGELARMYETYEERLERRSQDLTDSEGRVQIRVTEESRQPVTGPITVDFLQEREEEQWEAFVANNPHGNIYHTLAWKAVTEEGFGHRPYYLRAVDATGQFTGVLPLFLVKGIFGRRLVSMPMRDRGGVLARGDQIESLLVSRATQLTQELRCSYLELKSLRGLHPSILSEHNLRCERNWTTTRIDLSPGVEQLWKALDKNAVRWAINKARRQGVRVEIGDSEESMETFYEMFVRTRRSMGIPPFSKRLFQAIWRRLVVHNKANLFLVWKDSEPLTGMINLLSKDTFIPAYAAPQNQWRKLYPSEVVIWHTIEWSVQRGFHYYDFGADSPLQTGLLWFKKKWGGVHHPMSYCYFLNGPDAPPYFDSSAPTYELLRKVWTALPTPVCKSLGGWVTRQLS